MSGFVLLERKWLKWNSQTWVIPGAGALCSLECPGFFLFALGEAELATWFFAGNNVSNLAFPVRFARWQFPCHWTWRLGLKYSQHANALQAVAVAVTSPLSSFLLFWSRGGEQPEAQRRGDILGSGSNALSGEAAVKSSGSGSLQSLFVPWANKSSPSSSWVPNTDKVQTRETLTYRHAAHGITNTFLF